MGKVKALTGGGKESFSKGALKAVKEGKDITTVGGQQVWKEVASELPGAAVDMGFDFASGKIDSKLEDEAKAKAYDWAKANDHRNLKKQGFFGAKDLDEETQKKMIASRKVPREKNSIYAD